MRYTCVLGLDGNSTMTIICICLHGTSQQESFAFQPLLIRAPRQCHHGGLHWPGPKTTVNLRKDKDSAAFPRHENKRSCEPRCRDTTIPGQLSNRTVLPPCLVMRRHAMVDFEPSWKRVSRPLLMLCCLCGGGVGAIGTVAGLLWSERAILDSIVELVHD
jgi:hypothetical protein